jgi:(1->4)-alpha-D-glucan 1-alpha-D-glucosylmutase
MKFQQLTGPLMAKGFEDTMLYVYNRLLSLNDVGGNPDRFGISVKEFHDYNIRKARSQPHSMNATSTHDTKRGEDVRARLNVLSEIPDVWEASIKKWSKFNRRKKKAVKGMAVPDKNDEYFLYQTLAASMPFGDKEHDRFIPRVKEYAIKAVREAKVYTAWLKPDTDYEENYLAFIDKITKPAVRNIFWEDFLSFQGMVSFYGVFNSLSQTLLKIVSPGVPDIYQGSDFWDLNLVDPDNRRAVDFSLRAWLLNEIRSREADDILNLIDELLATKEDGRIKMFLIYKALAVRQTYRHVFEKGEYIPLETEGRYKEHVIAFAWKHKPEWIITVTPRLLTGVIKENKYPLGTEVWDDTRLILVEGSSCKWKNEITGAALGGEKTLAVGDIFRHFPCALLMNEIR